MNGFHLAQFNVARLTAPIDAPEVAEFRDALDRINALAEGSAGFIWRATGQGFDSHDPATDIDPMILANLSVWETAEALAAFAYRTAHSHFVKHRLNWFEPNLQPYQAMWWIPSATFPTREEALGRLDHLRVHGPGAHAFDFKSRFPAPTPQEEPVR
jgi:hypothetical protein